MTNPIAAACFLLVALSAGSVGGYFVGHVQGTAAERAAQDADTVAKLTQIIDAGNKLINDSNAASIAMRKALTTRSALDANTTKDIKDALAQTAASRVDCRFDDGVMRQLGDARNRAAAAAAGGIRHALPGSGSSSEQPR